MVLSAAVAQAVGFTLAQGYGSLSVTAPLLIVTMTGLIGYAAFSSRARLSVPETASN